MKLYNAFFSIILSFSMVTVSYADQFESTAKLYLEHMQKSNALEMYDMLSQSDRDFISLSQWIDKVNEGSAAIPFMIIEFQRLDKESESIASAYYRQKTINLLTMMQLALTHTPSQIQSGIRDGSISASATTQSFKIISEGGELRVSKNLKQAEIDRRLKLLDIIFTDSSRLKILNEILDIDPQNQRALDEKKRIEMKISADEAMRKHVEDQREKHNLLQQEKVHVNEYLRLHVVPKIQESVNDSYPIEAQKQNLQGKVIIEFTITRLGEITNVKLNQSSGRSVLDTAAIDAIKNIQGLPPFPESITQPEINQTVPLEYVMR